MRKNATMTKLEAWVWTYSMRNPSTDFQMLATQLSRPLAQIERAYDRAAMKNRPASKGGEK